MSSGRAGAQSKCLTVSASDNQSVKGAQMKTTLDAHNNKRSLFWQSGADVGPAAVGCVNINHVKESKFGPQVVHKGVSAASA